MTTITWPTTTTTGTRRTSWSSSCSEPSLSFLWSRAWCQRPGVIWILSPWWPSLTFNSCPHYQHWTPTWSSSQCSPYLYSVAVQPHCQCWNGTQVFHSWAYFRHKSWCWCLLWSWYINGTWLRERWSLLHHPATGSCRLITSLQLYRPANVTQWKHHDNIMTWYGE